MRAIKHDKFDKALHPPWLINPENRLILKSNETGWQHKFRLSPALAK